MSRLINLFFLLLFFGHSSKFFSQGNQYWEYANGDSAGIFSTNEKKPFKYGYALNKKQCVGYKKLIEDFGIKNGEVIASVGAASGWIEGILSLYVDSVAFYIQDIDTNYLTKDQLNRVVKYYSDFRETPQTNTFFNVLGTARKTNLPDTIFDKIILVNSFHEISNPQKIIRDLGNKIKVRGKIIVADNFSNDYRAIRHPDCYRQGWKVVDVIAAFEKEGLFLTNMKEPINSISNVLTFETSLNKANWYRERVVSVEPYVKEIDKLIYRESCRDTSFVNKTSSLLKIHFKEIHQIYSTLENHIQQIGYFWFGMNKYAEAVSVLKLNILLYPNSVNNYINVGYALRQMHWYEDALYYYKKGAALDPNDKDLQMELQKVEQILKSMR